MFKRKNRKGFTIVELVIVIAVIGILAAILIPTFVSLNDKANRAADSTLVHNLNNALRIEEAQEGKNKTLHDAVEDLDDYGYKLANLVSKSGEKLLWDQDKDEFVINPGEGEYNASKFWEIRSNMPEASNKRSIYAGNGWATENVNITNGSGFDAGTHNVSSINYSRAYGETDGTDSHDVVIRTNSFDTSLEINASKDTVKHFGEIGSLNIKAVANASYHENGSVKFVEISTGRIALEEGSEVNHIHINAKENPAEGENAFDEVIISYDKSVDLTEVGFSRDDVDIDETKGTLVVALQEGTETPTESTDMDYVWLTKQGIYEQIKVSDNDESAGNVWADDSSNSAQTQDAAQKIANNYVSETVRPSWDSDDTNRDLADINNATEVATAVAQEEAGEAWESMTTEQKAEAVAEKELVVVDADQAVEAQPDKADVETGVTLFAGGSGTKSDPWYIIDQETFQNVGLFYDENDTSKYYYWKVRSDITEIDMTGWTTINLQGYIYGNNVTLKNLTAPLFMEGAFSEKTNTIENMKIEANIVKPGGWVGVVFNWQPGSNVMIDNIDVSGYVEGNAIATYMNQVYDDLNATIKDSESSITMFGAEACGGMTGYIGMGSANVTLNVINSRYSGTMIRSGNTNFTYFGFNNNSAAHLTLTLDALSASADFTIKGNVPEAKTYTGTWAQLGNAQTIYTNESKKVVGSLTISVENNKFVAAQGSSTRAVATLMVGPNPGNMYAGYYTEEMILVDSNWVSDKLALFNITCDNTKPIGFASDGQSFNVHGDDGNIHIANILVTEYDSQGNVINVGKYTIPASYYPNGQAY